MRISTVFMVLVLLSAVLAALPAQADEEARVVHFVVIRSSVPGVNYAKELPEVEKYFLRMAGGYTELGQTRGGALQSGEISRETNYSYLVAAKRNIAQEIDSFIAQRFRDRPYILTWSAEEFALPE